MSIRNTCDIKELQNSVKALEERIKIMESRYHALEERLLEAKPKLGRPKEVRVTQ